jgi:hypothetical protein
LKNFGTGLGFGLGGRFDFTRVSLIGSLSYSQRTVNDAGFPYEYQAGTLGLSAAYRVHWPAVQLFLGAQLGATLAHQRVADGSAGTGLILSAGPTLGAALPIKSFLSLRFSVDPTLHRFELNGAEVYRPALHGSAAVEVGFE